VKFVKLRRPKITCSLSYVEYRPKTNASILWDFGHKGEVMLQRDRAKEGNCKLECG
jgi:hypothetical protein